MGKKILEESANLCNNFDGLLPAEALVMGKDFL